VGAPDQLLTSTVRHLQEAYAVDVIGAIVVAQEAAPAMKAAGSGTMIVTGGGFADHPIPALATVSLGKAALRSAATMLGADLGPDGIRVATLTIAGQIAPGTAFDPARDPAHRRALLANRPDGRPLAGGIPLHRRVRRNPPRGLPVTSFNLERSVRGAGPSLGRLSHGRFLVLRGTLRRAAAPAVDT
jgi:NAD(P)-dependent dehydrogenase (short-subunit alcohol dehydrogenase family)